MESGHTEASPQVKVTKPKPLLRGWFHAVAAVGAVALTVALCLLSWNDPPRMLTMLVFGLSMVELYAVSAVYHMGTWSPRVHRVLRAIDHSNIFVLIAGTYTPLCFNMLSGWLRVASLTTIWALALVGIALSVLTLKLPRMVGTILYIIMGWVSIGTLPALLEVLPVGAIALLMFGGVLYTIGGLIYARRWPDPFPRVLGFHEVFHLLVVAGGVVFAAVIAVWVLPFPRP
ncbi:MAG TPA: hemolysin III family protein [Chloroflexia bacterium]|jgi:hemolysin III